MNLSRKSLESALFLALLLFACGAHAQEAGADPNAAYSAAQRDLIACFGEIEKLRTEFQTAAGDRRRQIDAELLAMLPTIQQKVDKMISTAIEAYRANPGADPKIAEFLETTLEFQMVGRGPAGGGDDYESALPIIDALLTGGHERTELPMWGVLAAVATNDFAAAERFAAIAIEREAFTIDNEQGEFAKETLTSAMRYLRELDRYRERWEAEQAIRLREATADDLPRVKLTTTKGDLVIELFENEAPIAVANFITLIKQGFYDNVVYHRVLPRFMAQGGDPTGTGTGGPGHSIACECHEPDARLHFRGSLSMAHAGRDTGGSQFFLTFVPTDFLDGKHTVFGRVVEGFKVLAELQRIDPQRPVSVTPDRILKGEVLRDRGHAYEFEKLPGR